MLEKKRKSKKPDTQVYTISASDWDIYYSLVGIEKLNPYGPRGHSEDASLTIYGQVTYPKYKDVSRAQIYLTAEPELDDHWRKDYDGDRSSKVGYLQILRDKITLHLAASIPSRMYANLQISLAVGKIKYVKVYGERLKWGRGSILSISFSTKFEDN